MFGGLDLYHYKLLLFINMVTKLCDNLIVLNYIPAGYDYYINENAKFITSISINKTVTLCFKHAKNVREQL